MEFFMSFPRLIPLMATTLLLLSLQAHGQQNNPPCTPSMLSSFGPCMSFVTNNSSVNASSPSADCCNSLKSLTNSGMGCLCLILTGAVPFQVPINQSLAVSLPRACNMPGVPLQCKASVAPVPAPGPVSFAPPTSPEASPSATPKAPLVPEPITPSLAPAADSTPDLQTPPSSVGSQAPANTGSRPELNTSAAMPSNSFSSSLLLLPLALVFSMLY